MTGGEAVLAGREVQQWIRDISDLHRSKPPPSVHYKHPMPDVDKIMQVDNIAVILEQFSSSGVAKRRGDKLEHVSRSVPW